MQGAAPFPAGAGRSTSRTLVFPFVTPPQPPSSSGASFGNVIPPALSNSLDLIIVVHQPTPLYPGDLFSFILQLGVPETPPTSPTPSTLSLSFSAHVLRHDPTPADDKAYAHHTLFTQTSTIPLPSHLGSTPLSLPFTTSVPLQAECETCSARYETMPPSLRVETPQHLLQARASYKLVAIWGEKAAVAEVQVEQREAVVGGMVSRGGWVKLEGEKDMRGSWKGWELIKMEVRGVCLG